MVTSIKQWWRIELDKSGAILSCSQVEATERQTSHVRYVEAMSKVEACSDVKAWHTAYLQKRKEYDWVTVQGRRVAGLCIRCGQRPPRAKRTKCQACTDQEAQRKRDLRAGLKTARVPFTAENAWIGRRAHNSLTARLPAVLKKFDELGPIAFRQWLVNEIETRKTKTKEKAKAKAA